MKIKNKNDLIIFTANIVFVASLIPSILSPDKPNIATSTIQILLSGLYIIVYRNIKFKFALIANIIIAALWLILFLQKFFNF